MKNFKLGTFFSGQSIFTLAFFYALSAGLLVQWVLLPVLLPGLHASSGLLKGGDWVWFHQEAVLLAERIHHEGWGVWELRPHGNTPIGIAAVVYAVSGISKPWVLMPINAGIFAVGALCLYLSFACIVSRRLAFVATLPYLLFPSAMVIYGQMHKDAWTIAGSLLVNLAWVRFALPGKLGWRSLLRLVAPVLAGLLLVWAFRPYLVKILVASSTMTVLLLVIRAIIIRYDLHEKCTARWWVGIILCLSILIAFTKLPLENIVLDNGGSDKGGKYIIGRLVESIADARKAFAESSPNAGSNIDTGVKFHSAIDILRYVPRALQIGLFAPFPESWSEPGVSPGSNCMRLLAGIEMSFAYLVLPGAVLLFTRREYSGVSVVALIQAVVPIIILAQVICNVGTLYRMRYGYWQILLGLGVIGWGIGLQRWNAKYRRIVG